MKTTNNTILITGGSAGIGLEMARSFINEGNKVIITGRNEERLKKAAAELPGVVTIVSDVNDSRQIDELVVKVKKEHPALNMLINNAGKAHVYKLGTGADAAQKAREEMQTNYLSILELTEKLLPVLLQQPAAAIVNVSSIVAFVPGSTIPTYAASKAALHSYSQSLRFTLKDTPLKVFELMPPLVNTDFSQDIGGSKGIHPSVVAQDLLKAIGEDNYQVHVGQTEMMYQLSRTSPTDAFMAMNGGN